jgi:small-conductance mechanosensitive channel
LIAGIPLRATALQCGARREAASPGGNVIDIGLHATKIKTTDNIIIVIPNNEIMKRDKVNYTLISSDILVPINIGLV